MFESDATDDHPEDWAIVDLDGDDEAITEEIPPPWGAVTLALVLVLCVVIMVWSGVFTYG